MACPLGIQYENAYYHLTCRGNARQEIFEKDEEYSVFLDLLNQWKIGEMMGLDYSSVSVGRKRLHNTSRRGGP